MRNFWIDTWIEGRKNRLSSGPKSNHGRMETFLNVKNQGISDTILRMTCSPLDSGLLLVTITDYDDGSRIFEKRYNPRRIE